MGDGQGLVVDPLERGAERFDVTLASISARAYVDAIAGLGSPPAPPPAEIVARSITLDERAAVIRSALRRTPQFVLQELLHDVTDRIVVAVTFMALLELSRFSIYLLHAMGVTLVVARLLHAYALSLTDKFKFGRFWGTALTFGLLLAGGVLCLYQGLRASALL